MTKPVQIPVYRLEYPMPSLKTGIDRFVKEADHQAALLQVREMLEAKAKEWLDMHGTAEEGTGEGRLVDCADELLALAATLGNQGK